MFFGFEFRRAPGAGNAGRGASVSALSVSPVLSLVLNFLSRMLPRCGILFAVACFGCGTNGLNGPDCEAGRREAPPDPEVFDGKTLFRLGWGDDLCAVTFDDGPGRHTLRLLEILGGRGIPATFFVVGSRAEQYPSIVRRIQEQGHEVANHSFSHMTLRGRDPLTQRQEIERVQKFLADLGVVSRFVRPPYGRYDAETVRIAADLGLSIVLWSVDSMDWEQPPRMEHMRTQVRGQKTRGIFLFHDTHALTVEAIPRVLDGLAADGCRFVTVSAYLDAVRTPPRSGAGAALSCPVRLARPAGSGASSDALRNGAPFSMSAKLAGALAAAVLPPPFFRDSFERFVALLLSPAGVLVR